MKNYPLYSSIQKYGATPYLSNLRKKYLAGLFSYERYVELAASTYLLMFKPKRALALLDSIDTIKTDSDTRLRIEHIKSKALAFPDNSSPTCSLNMIVKNERENIATALDSIDDIMDEIIVCDTGSIDGTGELARLYGALVKSIDWHDDFSAARNEALAASACSWIFWMDADDCLDCSCKADLVNLWKGAPAQAAAFCVVNMLRGRPGPRFMQIRLFPRIAGLRFERLVHEQIVFSAQRSHVPFTHYPTIVITHRGYNEPAQQKAKAARNKALIKTELKRFPSDPALLISYADCCMALELLSEAFTVYEYLANSKGLLSLYPHIAIQACYNAAVICYKEKKIFQAQEWLFTCVRLDVTRTEAHYLLGKIFEELGNEEGAFDAYMKSARIIPPVRPTATDAHTIRIESIHCLGRLLIKVDRFTDAEELLSRAVSEFPEVVQFHSSLGTALLKQQKLKQAARFFMQSLSISADRNREAFEGMARIYETMQDYTKAKLFKEMAEKTRN